MKKCFVITENYSEYTSFLIDNKLQIYKEDLIWIGPSNLLYGADYAKWNYMLVGKWDNRPYKEIRYILNELELAKKIDVKTFFKERNVVIQETICDACGQVVEVYPKLMQASDGA